MSSQILAHLRWEGIGEAEKRGSEEAIMQKIRPLVRSIQVRMWRGNLEVFVHAVAYGVETHAVDEKVISGVQSLGFWFVRKESNVFVFEPLFDLLFLQELLVKEGLAESETTD